MGSRVEMKEQSSEIKEGIALSYSTANASAVVADVKTRKRTSVSLACAPIHSPEVSGLCNILKFLVQQHSTKLGKFMHT